MKFNKILLVTFPVDFGSHTLAQTYSKWLEPRVDLEVFNFSPHETSTRRDSYFVRILKRFISSMELNVAIIKARIGGRVIIMQQISPSIFGYPALIFSKYFIMLDWTRRLYEPIIKQKMSPTFLSILHSIVLRSARGVIAFTAAAENSLTSQYHVPPRKIYRMSLPYDVDTIQQSDSTSSPVRIVFVGGDFNRKGGSLLADWSKTADQSLFELTFVTQSEGIDSGAGTVLRNETGQSAAALLHHYDIFALPTKFDAFPVALGEAAAAGLALLTTKNALGSTEVVQDGVNGYIAASDQEFIERLNQLVSNTTLVARFKESSRSLMVKSFNFDPCFDRLIEIVSEGKR